MFGGRNRIAEQLGPLEFGIEQFENGPWLIDDGAGLSDVFLAGSFTQFAQPCFGQFQTGRGLLHVGAVLTVVDANDDVALLHLFAFANRQFDDLTPAHWVQMNLRASRDEPGGFENEIFRSVAHDDQIFAFRFRRQPIFERGALVFAANMRRSGESLGKPFNGAKAKSDEEQQQHNKPTPSDDPAASLTAWSSLTTVTRCWTSGEGETRRG